MPKKKPKEGKPEVHSELQGFEININEFGEIVSNFNIDKINDFQKRETWRKNKY